MDDPGPVSGIFYFLCDTQGQDTGRIKWLSRVSFPGATIIPVTPGVTCWDTCSKTTKKGAGMGEKEKACKFLVIHSINYVNVPI